MSKDAIVRTGPAVTSASSTGEIAGQGSRPDEIYVQVWAKDPKELDLARKHVRNLDGENGIVAGYIKAADLRELRNRGMLVTMPQIVRDVMEPAPAEYPARAVLSTRGPVGGTRRQLMADLRIEIKARMGSDLLRGITYGENQYLVIVPTRAAWQSMAKTHFVLGFRRFDPAKDVDPFKY